MNTTIATPACSHRFPRRVTGLLAVAAAILLVLLTTAANRSGPDDRSTDHAALASMPGEPPTPIDGRPSTVDTGVPDASTALAGREFPIEEPAPTF